MSVGPIIDPDEILEAEGGLAEAEPALGAAGRQGAASRRWRAVTGNIGLIYLLLLVLLAVIGPTIAPYGANAIDVHNIGTSMSASHWLGTDELGRDIFSRLLLGVRSSLEGILLAVGVAVVLGGIWGLLAGYGPKIFDELLMRLADCMLAFPALVLAVAVVAALGANLVHGMVTIGILFAPGLARLIRGEVLKVRGTDYVNYARRYGMSAVSVARVHVLPNVLPPLVVQCVLLCGIALIAESGLAFLGLGPQPPSPNWGASLGNSFQYIEQRPGLMVVPGIAIITTVLAINAVGDRLHMRLSK
jgi:peptide/nickel transport system permease protein